MHALHLIGGMPSDGEDDDDDDEDALDGGMAGMFEERTFNLQRQRDMTAARQRQAVATLQDYGTSAGVTGGPALASRRNLVMPLPLSGFASNMPSSGPADTLAAFTLPMPQPIHPTTASIGSESTFWEEMTTRQLAPTGSAGSGSGSGAALPTGMPFVSPLPECDCGATAGMTLWPELADVDGGLTPMMQQATAGARDLVPPAASKHPPADAKDASV